MVKTKIKNIVREGRGRDVAWHFFVDYTNCTKISNKLYPDTRIIYKKGGKKISWSMPQINGIFHRLLEKGFLYVTNLPQKINRYNKIHHQSVEHYILNLFPLFDYYKDKINPKGFTQTEKSILNWIFYPVNTRFQMYKLYRKNDDVINAIMKFYVGALYIPSKRTNQQALLDYYKKYLPNKSFILGLSEREIKRGLTTKEYPNEWDEEPLPKDTESFNYLLSKNAKYVEYYESSFRMFEQGEFITETITSAKDKNIKLKRRNFNIKITPEFTKFNSFYLAHYIYLHKCLPGVMNELDKKMLQALGLCFEYKD